MIFWTFQATGPGASKDSKRNDVCLISILRCAAWACISQQEVRALTSSGGPVEPVEARLQVVGCQDNANQATRWYGQGLVNNMFDALSLSVALKHTLRSLLSAPIPRAELLR